jgi:hypothetical protein
LNTSRFAAVTSVRPPGGERCCGAEQARDGESPQLGSELVGRSGDEGAHLVQRPGAVSSGAAASQPQHPDCFDVAVASLRRAECITGERGSCGAHRVVAVGLAGSASTLPVRPVNLHDSHPDRLEMAGQTRAVASGPCDTHQHLDEAWNTSPRRGRGMPTSRGDRSCAFAAPRSSWPPC